MFSDTNQKGTWMIIDVIEGKDLSPYSIFPEEEVLLTPNSVFSVKDMLSSDMKEVLGHSTNLDVIHLIQKPTPKHTKLEI